jgi:hypothetical protein
MQQTKLIWVREARCLLRWIDGGAAAEDST